ncbi:3-hydroxyacyl-CoA dehydrogenase [Nocardia pseudovaccinii]|uniref:3-hydroxyacyl-CoA dehydrogenase n=1 Tax=Nocardia pseudovaccinii TaxID=189540 RepID=UPI0007A54BFF|nr:3-hydroxyacyl-CoA dehydrogenase [Nocardia pseudovaccinii]
MAAIERIRIVGAGAMGRGIAQVAATAGYQVEVTDSDPRAVTAALDFIATMVRRSVDRGRCTGEEAAAILARLCPGVSPTAPADDVDLVIEAVVEDLAVKQSILAELEIATPTAILASNTSSLSIGVLATALGDPGRLVGLHFFNPVPLMRLVEIVPGLRTRPELVDTARSVVERIGHTGIVVRDTPGFLVNHVGRALPTEALTLLSEQAAAPADIDRIVRDVLGLRMGPFELLDLTGLDVSHPVMETVFAGFYNDPRLRPSPLAAARTTAGLLGRKTGEGFYRYDGGERESIAEPEFVADPAAIPVYVHEHPEFAATLRSAGASVLESPSPAAVSLVFPVGEPAYRLAVRAGLAPSRTLGVDPLSVTGKRLVVAVPVTADPVATAPALAVLAAPAALTLTADGPAPVAQRILATMVNLACAIAESGIATPADIDRGAQLGLGYPQGPLDYGDSVGAALITRILDGIHAYTGDPRYRANGWLRTHADLGLSLRARETRPTDLMRNRGSHAPA